MSDNEKAIHVLTELSKADKRIMFPRKDIMQALDTAIKALQEIDFLTFLMNTINPNELETYLSMYNAQNEKGSEETE